MTEGQDAEVTLGTGRLLGLFFGLVVLCALFFSLGFSLGRNSVKVEAATSSPLPVSTATAAPKPSASTKAGEASAPAASPSTSDELTFYKSVEQKDAKAQLEKPAPAPAAEAPAAEQPAPAAVQPVAMGPGYMVQVAAVTKQEDADALVNALRKKQYPVFVTSVPTDKLFHVQVGPFPDAKDAEAMRSRLLGDGYNPIVKK